MATSNNQAAILLVGLVVGMLGLSYASVPLYRLFCQKTGYGGTPKQSSELPQKIGKRVIRVRFNADVNPGLPWAFRPLQQEMQLRLGALGLAFYETENKSGEGIWGMATYNVTPEKAAPYFNKVACFCFEEQWMEPEEKSERPVQFFIDPAFDEDPHLKEVSTITLSYTFFRLKRSS